MEPLPTADKSLELENLLLLPPARHAKQVRAELEPALRERLLDPALRIGQDLPVLGVSALPTGRCCVRSEGIGSWVLAELSDDPAATWRGRIPIPRSERDKLMALRRAGISCDLIVLAHEIPPTWADGEPLPRLVPEPETLHRLDARLIGVIEACEAVAVGFVLGICRLGSAIGDVLDAVSFTSTSQSSGSAWPEDWGGDPVILGGIKHPTEKAAAWAVLAQWRWNQ